MDIHSFYQWCCNLLQRDRPASTLRLSDFDQLSSTLLPGDVILIDGRSRLDEALKNITSSRWSRGILYLGQLHDIADPALRSQLSSYLPCEADTRLILDARLDQGITLRALSLLQQEHVRICRPRSLNDEQRQAMIRHAISRLGVGAQRSWFAILILLLPWSLLPRRWRTGTFATLAGSLLRQITGTPVGEAFSFIQFPVLPLVKQKHDGASQLYSRQPGIYFAADFDHSPYFDVIKYPFIDQLDNPRVRLQPWSGQHDALSGTAKKEDNKPQGNVVRLAE